MLHSILRKYFPANNVPHLIRKIAYYLVVSGLTIALFFAFAFLTQPASSQAVPTEKLLFGGLSALMNLYVLYYHVSYPPHPKFSANAFSRRVLRIHIVAGCLELGACLLAYFTGNVAWAMGAAVVALGGQIPTAYYQMTTVFGVRAVMSGTYLFVITLHLFCAFQLLRHPDSTYWLLNTFLALNTYVWVRVFYFLFKRIGLFREHIYTASVLAACLLVFPAVLGGVGNVVFGSYVAATVWLYYRIRRPDAHAHERYVTEYAREDVTRSKAGYSWAFPEATQPIKPVRHT